jgi:anti-sigma B factor antagonist
VGTARSPNGSGGDAEHVQANFSIATSTSDDEVRLYLRGELDMASADDLSRALEAVSAGSASIVFDCGGLSYCDSYGVRAILLAARRCREESRLLRIEHATGRTRQILEISGVTQLVDLT